MPEWYDSLQNVDSTVDQSFQLSGLDVLDSIFGGQLAQQTKSNIEDPTYLPRIQEEQNNQAAAEEDNYRKALREQRREELLKTTQFENVPTLPRIGIGLEQGGYGIARQVGGLLDALRIPGGRQLANYAQEKSNQLADITDVPDSAYDPVGEFAQWMANNATSVIPSLAAGPFGGLPAMAVAAGAQTFGSVFEDAQDKYQENGLDEGTARLHAYFPALLSGISTAALTKAFGAHGTEALLLNPNREAIKQALKEPIMTILRGAGSEFSEEGLDQFVQGLVASYSYDPKKSFGSVVADAVQAGAAGGLLGGPGEAVQVGRTNLESARRGLRRGRVVQESGTTLTNEPGSPSNGAVSPINPADAAQPLSVPRGTPPMARWFDQLQDVAPTSPVGPGIVQPGASVQVGEDVPQFAPELQPSPYVPSQAAAAAAQAAAQQAQIGPGRVAPVPGVDFVPPAGIEQPVPPAAVLASRGLRRGRTLAPIQPGEPYAITQREEVLQPERERADGQIQSVGPDRNVAPEIQAQGAQTIAGDSVPPGREVAADSTKLPQISSELVGREQRPDDILDFINDQIGKINGKKTARSGTEGYYGESYKGLLRRSAVRDLFTNDGSGRNPDEVVDDLRRAGYLGQDATVDDLWELMDAAATKRQSFVEDQKKFTEEVKAKEAQRIDFEQTAMGQQSKWAGKDPIQTSELLVGDTFKIGGEEFTVKDLIFDPETDQLAYVEVEDGKRYGTQTVDGNQVLHVSRGSYKPNEAATEFVPKSQRELTGDEVAALDRQINELKAKETLTANEHRQLELLEQQRGQKFMEFNDPVRVQEEQDQQRQQAEISARVSAPLSAPDLRTQREMFQEPGQEEMFSLSPEAQAALPASAKPILAAFLRMPVMRDLDWSGLRVELADLEKGVVGRRIGRLIQLSRNAESTTFPHEIAHILFDALPAEYRQAIEESRQAELATRFPRGVPSALLKGITSRQYVESGMAPGDYRYSNQGEFLAHLFADKVSQKAFEERHGVSMWQRIRNWFVAMMDAVNRAFGRRPDIDRVIREMIAGTWAPNLEEDAKLEEQFSYRKTAEEAQNAALLAKTAEEQEVEGHNQLAQSTDLLATLIKHGVNDATPSTKKVLGFNDLTGINAAGEGLIGLPMDYNTVRAATVSSPTRSKMAALSAATQIRGFEEKLNEAIRKSDQAQKDISRSGFIKKFAKDQSLKTDADAEALINRVAGPMFESAYKMAKKALDEESRNDVRIAQLEAQLNEVDKARGSSSAMSILVRDFVDVLSSSPEGIALLSNPNPRRADLVNLYKDIKRSAGQSLYNDSLINWAAFILERNADLRDTLWAANLSRNSNIRAGMGAYETKLIADLEKDEKGTIVREIRSAQKRQKKEDLARFAYQTLHKEVIDELSKAGLAIEAGDIATRIKGDPDFKNFRKQVYNDAGVEGTFESAEPGRDQNFVLPSGTVVDTSINGMKGNSFPTKRWVEWDSARDELSDWLNNNPDHPDYGVHQRNLQNLEEFYLTQSMLSPSDREHVFSNGMNTVLDAVRNIGGRGASMVSDLVARWGLMKDQAAHFSKEWSDKLVEQRLDTLKSHGLKWNDNGGSLPIEKVNSDFYEQHLNQVLYSLNRDAGALRVGDTTQSGMVVTKEDLADARLQHEATNAGFHIIQKNLGWDNFVIDKRSGYVLQRRPGKTSEDMVPRIMDDDQEFLKAFTAAREQYRQAKTDPERDAATAQQIKLIDDNWDRVGYPYVWDRNADFASATPFDGAGGAYEQIAQKMERNPASVNSFDQLLDEVVSLSAVTRDEARSIMLADMGKMFENGYKEETDSGLITTPVTGEKKNTVTRARGKEVLPYSFYRYGFGNSPDVQRYSGMLHSRGFERLIGGLSQLRDELIDRQKELERKAKKIGASKATSERAIETANGTNVDSFADIEEKLAGIEKVIAHLTEAKPETPSDIWFTKIINAVQGSLIGNSMTTAKNLFGGPKFLATALMRLNGKAAFEFPQAAYQLWVLQGLTKSIPSLAKSIGLGTIKSVPAFGRAVREAAKNPDSKIRTFLGEAASAWLDETGRQIYKRQKDIANLDKRGLDFISNPSQEFKNKLGAGFLAGGQLLEKEIRGVGNKTGHTVAAALDLLNTPFKGFFSAMGEHALNAGINQGLELIHKPVIVRALNKVYDQIKSGKRAFNWDKSYDRVNRLTYQELFPKKIGGKDTRLFNSADDLRNMEATYKDAGLSAQDEFFKYLKQMHDGIAKPEYLSQQASDLLANYELGLLNKSTAAQQPLFLQGKSKWNTAMRPLFGWSARTLNGLNRTVFSVPTKTGNAVADAKALQKARIKQYMFLSTLGLLPMLLAFSAAGLAEEKGSRLLSKYLWGQERASRYPWEREGTESQAIGWLINATYGIPFVDMVMNATLNDLPARASLDPNIVMLNKGKDLANYIGGAIQTGDPSFGFVRLVEGFYPDSRIVLNRIESEQGKRAGSDVVALLRRLGPQDLVKPPGGPASGPNYTQMSPYGQRMENAALRQDWGELQRVYDEAVQKAIDLGRPFPERLVRQMFEARNPFTRALKTKMTDDQYQEFLAKLDDNERSTVESVVNSFEQGGNLIGTNPSVTKEERAQDRSGGGTGLNLIAQLASQRRSSLGMARGVNTSALSNLRATRQRSFGRLGSGGLRRGRL